MKKLFLFLLLTLFFQTAFSKNFNDKGLVSGRGYFPLQAGIGLGIGKNLVDEKTNTIFSFGLLGIQQRSAVFSLALLNELQNNYGLLLAPVMGGTHANYGISCGLVNLCDKSYGLQIGGANISKNFLKNGNGNLFGINIADFIQIGAFNSGKDIQIGVINLREYETEGYFQCGLFNNGTSYLQFSLFNGGDAFFQAGLLNAGESFLQIGLLNYNPKSYISWMPFFNFDMGYEEKQQPPPADPPVFQRKIRKRARKAR